MRPQLRIRSPNFNWVFPLGEGPALITDGIGGWQIVERPKDVDLTTWGGTAPIGMRVPLMLDRHAVDGDVQYQLNRILRLGRTRANGRPPRAFRAIGPIPFSGEWFVLEGVEMGEGAIRGSRGQLARQPLTLLLREHVPSDRIKIRRKRAARKRYRTKQGDTLMKIARKLGEDRKYARAIGKRNGIRDIRRKVKPGRVLKLPPR